jgi:hypothetical protein
MHGVAQLWGLALVRLAQDSILGHFQPSLRDWIVLFTHTQDYVLGYSQPSLRDWGAPLRLKPDQDPVAPCRFPTIPLGLRLGRPLLIRLEIIQIREILLSSLRNFSGMNLFGEAQHQIA